MKPLIQQLTIIHLNPVCCKNLIYPLASFIMNTTILNKESDIIKVIAGDFARYPLQVNSLLEADAEIIKLPGKDEYLVLKTDGKSPSASEQALKNVE